MSLNSALAINGGPRHIPGNLPLASPPTTELDREFVLNSLNSSKHAWGENCELLQSEWAEWNGNQNCMAVSSGTFALQMALVACGMQAGDEVLTPAYSWTSSATCILHGGGIPVFVDIDPLWINMDPEKIEAAITPRTKGIVAVHLHGVPAPMDEIMAIARKHGLFVVEDACQAHGALYKGAKVGTIGDAAAFSLNQNKMLSAGEGGLFVCDNKEKFERGTSLVLFCDFAIQKSDLDPNRAHGLGVMGRYNELCAAYARSQLRQLDDGIRHAREMSSLLRKELADLPGLILPIEPPWADENGYNFVCHLDPVPLGYMGPVNWLREAIVEALQAEGVPAAVWQRRILPELAVIVARDAYGNGSPWAEHGSEVDYNPAVYPHALYHSASYFIIGGMRRPNTKEFAYSVVEGIRKVWSQFESLDVESIASKADMSIYERGWKPRQKDINSIEVVLA